MTILDLTGQSAAASSSGWIAVCTVGELLPERGVCAVVAGRQVAVVRTHDGRLFAVGQRDPFSGAFVMSRGLVGTRTVEGGPRPVLQSPVFKQAFDLATGRCLDDPAAAVSTWPVREHDGVVEVGSRPSSDAHPPSAP